MNRDCPTFVSFPKKAMPNGRKVNKVSLLTHDQIVEMKKMV